MTNGQIQQLQDLSKCYISNEDDAYGISSFADIVDGTPREIVLRGFRLSDSAKANLRRLTHQYRHQIRAIRRNAKAAV